MAQGTHSRLVLDIACLTQTNAGSCSTLQSGWRDAIWLDPGTWLGFGRTDVVMDRLPHGSRPARAAGANTACVKGEQWRLVLDTACVEGEQWRQVPDTACVEGE